MTFLFVILSFDLIISSKIDHENREDGQDQSFIVLQAMQQHFARLEVQMNDMLDQIEQNEEMLG